MSSNDLERPKPRRCPVCASDETKMAVETNYGAYWRCSACGHVWHEDTRPRPKTPPFFERYWAAVLAHLSRDLIELRPRLPEPRLPCRKVCA
jgi:rubredoxin